MASFSLKKSTMQKLQAKFEEFTEARRKVHANIQDYINSYRNFTGTRSDRQAALEEEYMPRSPQMGWLILRDGKDILYNFNGDEDKIQVLGTTDIEEEIQNKLSEKKSIYNNHNHSSFLVISMILKCSIIPSIIKSRIFTSL